MPHIKPENHEEILKIFVEAVTSEVATKNAVPAKATIAFKNAELAFSFASLINDYALYGSDGNPGWKDFYVDYRDQACTVCMIGNIYNFSIFLKHYDNGIYGLITENADIMRIINESEKYALTEEELDKACEEQEKASKSNEAGTGFEATKEPTPPQTPPPAFPQDLEGRSSTPPIIKAH